MVMSFLVIQVLLLATSPSYADNSYGDVNFETSCSAAVQGDFNTALSMMYSFWYSESLLLFDDVLARDPQCCMAHWGAAMTYSHPVWDFIQDSRLAEAAARSDQAAACASSTTLTARELAYLGSLAVYTNLTDPAVELPADRLQVYADNLLANVYEPYGSSDSNAGIMYGLALIAVGYYSEQEPARGFPSLTRAGLVEELVLLDVPDSPGALHYVIHSYDQPAPAYRALAAAYHYLNASVSVPHAIHMPSHIFGNLGLWSDMVEANVLSLDTAYATAGQPTGDWYHGSYFMQFGMLQLAMDCDASALVDSMRGLAATDADGFNAEAAVRIPLMYLVETRQWEQAAEFNLSTFYVVDPRLWRDNVWTEINSNMVVTVARALLDYPGEDISRARQAVEDANHTLLSDPLWTRHQLPYWRLSFNVMVESARAWEAFRLVSFDEGIRQMEAVRTLQVESWAPEVSHAWDANEQMAEMLLMRDGSGDLAYALQVYEEAMAIYPKRYRSTAGAARCAELLGDDVKASAYYGDLLTLAAPPFPTVTTAGVPRDSCPPYSADRRPELVQASAYFAARDSSSGDSGDSIDTDKEALFLALSFVAGAAVAAVALLAAKHFRDKQAQEGLLANQVQKAKYSF